jgi:hypothetical protein
MKKKPGGRRPGAGRKPTDDPINRKKSFYLRKSQSIMTQQEVRAALDRVALLEEKVSILSDALKTIAKGEGRYCSDPLRHAENTIQDMIEIAKAALSR